MAQVILDDDAVQALRAILSLVHYDGLALSWARHVPREILPNRVIRDLKEVDRLDET